MVTCRNKRPRQKLSPCVDGEAGGAVSGQTVFCLCLLFSASASASRSGPPPGSPSPPLAPVPASDPTGAGSRRARTPSEAHIALYRERMRRSCAPMSTPSSSGRGFVRGKRSIKASSADAWCAPRLRGERKREENADQRRGPVKSVWATMGREGRTHPCRSSPSRKWRSKAVQRLRRSRALPKARSPSLHRERVPRLVRVGDRAHTPLCIQPCRTFLFIYKYRVLASSPRATNSRRKYKAHTFALDPQAAQGRHPGYLYRYIVESRRS